MKKWWASVPQSAETAHLADFTLPEPLQPHLLDPAAPLQLASEEEVVRAVDVVTHRNFTKAQRRKAVETAVVNRMHADDPVQKDQFVLLHLSPTNPNTPYKYRVTLGKVVKNVSAKDTTDPDTEFKVQIYCPSDIANFCKQGNKMNMWKGSDNKLWRPTVKRANILCIFQQTLTKTKLMPKQMRSLVQQYINDTSV